EIFRVLERDVLWRLLAARGLRQLAIGKPASALFMDDLAVRRRAACRIDLPLLRGGLDQHGAGAGPAFAQLCPPRPDRIGIAGDLQTKHRIAVELVVWRRMLERHVWKIGVEFLG